MLTEREAAEAGETNSAWKRQVTGERLISCTRRKGGIFPGEQRGRAEARDWPGSIGTQPIRFQAGFGFMSPQQTGQLISPVITIPHCYYRRNNWFTGRLLSNTDRLAGATPVTSTDGELSK